MGKQARKHLAKRMARLQEKNERRRLANEQAIVNRTAQMPYRVQSVDFLGSSVPVVGYGTIQDLDGSAWSWVFRFRFDRAFLEVGAADPDERRLIGDCVASASRDDVTGDPYAGWLNDEEAVALVVELVADLHPPADGERFQERLHNTVELLSGAGDLDSPTLIRYL